MPSSFSVTFFNRYRIQYEWGAFSTEFSCVYFSLPSIIDIGEEINRYMGSVNIVPMDVSEDSFEVEGGICFGPSKLDYDNLKENK